MVLDGKSDFLKARSCALFSGIALAGSFAVLRVLMFFSAVLLSPAMLQAEDSPDIKQYTIHRDRKTDIDFSSKGVVKVPDIAVVEKSGTYNIDIDVVVDAPADYVRYVLTDYSHLYRLNPSILESTILAQGEDGAVKVKTRIKGCASYFCEELDRVEQVKVLPTGQIVAEIIPQHGEFKSGKTNWSITAMGESCEVSYRAELKPDIYIPPVVSKFLVKKAIKQEAQTSFTNLERMAANLCSGQYSDAEKPPVCK